MSPRLHRRYMRCLLRPAPCLRHPYSTTHPPPHPAHLGLLRRRRSDRPEPARRSRPPLPRSTAVTSAPVVAAAAADTATRPHTRRRQRGSVAAPPDGYPHGAPSVCRGRRGRGAGARAGGAVGVRDGFQDLRLVLRCFEQVLVYGFCGFFVAKASGVYHVWGG